MTAFAYEIRKGQVDWHRGVLKDQHPGYQNGNPYDHALPRSTWELNVWFRKSIFPFQIAFWSRIDCRLLVSSVGGQRSFV